jgi:riboflavin-specific deaminase-like protein
MSLDGCIGLPGPKPLRLSSAEDLRRVHALRAASDAILVGVGTLLADDPKLTVKWELLGRPVGRNPTRVILDAALRTPAASEVAKPGTPTILFHANGATGGPPGVERVPVTADEQGRLALSEVLRELERRGLRRLMVEGGARVLSEFLSQRLVDELTVYVAPTVVGLPDAPRLFVGRGPMELGLPFRNAEKLGDGVLLRFAR